MKRLCFAFFTLLSLGIAGMVWAAGAAAPAASTNAVIHHVDKALDINSGMDIIAGGETVLLSGKDPDKVVNGKVKNDSELSAVLKLAEDGKNFYIACDVTQGRHPLNKMNFENSWNADCLELYVSSKSDIADANRMAKSDWDYQIVLSPSSDKGKPVIRNYPANTLNGAKIVVKNKAKGYVMTASIPLSDLKDCDWAPGKTYKFDAAIAKAGKSGFRDNRIWWHSTLDAYDNPSRWGAAEIK